jgi:succinyl-diaminopimelate desuccinylase
LTSDDLISAAVQKLEPDLVRITSDLIGFNTSRLTGTSFRECAEYLCSELRRAGLEVQLLPVTDEEIAVVTGSDSHYRALGLVTELAPRFNVIGHLAGSGGGASLHVNGHYCVPEPVGEWSGDPFIARLTDRTIVGRGAIDMKGGLAVTIVALKALHEAHVQPRGDIFASATVDTHFGGDLGAGYLARTGLGRADRGIVTDASGPTRIVRGYRGVLWMEIVLTGTETHGSLPFYGVNPVEAMAQLIVALRMHHANLQKLVSSSPIVPEEARRPSLMVGSILSSNQLINMVPGECRLGIDRRILPEERIDTAEAEIATLVDDVRRAFPDVTIELRKVFATPPTVTPADDPLVRTIAARAEEVTGVTTETLVIPNFLDLRWFTETWGIPGVVYGPGESGAGTDFTRIPSMEPDESIAVEDLLKCAQTLALSVADLTA